LPCGSHYGLITGTIPTELGGIPGLKLLQLSRNRLTGTVPSQLGLLPNSSVWLDNNSLTGLPIFHQCNFRKFTISRNKFEGGISKQIENCKNLETQYCI